jgi:hypothetical protein
MHLRKSKRDIWNKNDREFTCQESWESKIRRFLLVFKSNWYFRTHAASETQQTNFLNLFDEFTDRNGWQKLCIKTSNKEVVFFAEYLLSAEKPNYDWNNREAQARTKKRIRNCLFNFCSKVDHQFMVQNRRKTAITTRLSTKLSEPARLMPPLHLSVVQQVVLVPVPAATRLSSAQLVSTLRTVNTTEPAASVNIF